jgi:hypothetical protein
MATAQQQQTTLIDTALPLDDKREMIKEILRHGVYHVEFTKVDGSRRLMPCTLMYGLIPQEKAPQKLNEERSTPARAENPNIVRAFDTDKQEWRSFRVDSVIAVTE